MTTKSTLRSQPLPWTSLGQDPISAKSHLLPDEFEQFSEVTSLTFYEQLLRKQISQAPKRLTTWLSFYAFGIYETSKMNKCQRNILSSIIFDSRKSKVDQLTTIQTFDGSSCFRRKRWSSTIYPALSIVQQKSIFLLERRKIVRNK